MGVDCDGGFAEHDRVPTGNACRDRSLLSDAELASFPCSYTATENMLTRAMLVAGDTVLVTDACGGVGGHA